jgi:hypothetical protein
VRCKSAVVAFEGSRDHARGDHFIIIMLRPPIIC